MFKRLYCLRDPRLDPPGRDARRGPNDRLGIEPFTIEHRRFESAPAKRVGLKRQLGWREVTHLQRVLRAADMWDDFPEPDLILVSAEVWLDRGAHRLDLLYLRGNGGLVPCELKIGGRSRATHRQLIRYMKKLDDEAIDMAWIRKQRASFLRRIKDDATETLHDEKFAQFVADRHVTEGSLHVVRNSGFILDEGFPEKLRDAVRDLNTVSGFAIRLVELRGFVGIDWQPDAAEFSFVLDFVEVE